MFVGQLLVGYPSPLEQALQLTVMCKGVWPPDAMGKPLKFEEGC